ncbi:MAG TPA: transglutaminase-like domain-containing protein [Actinomycetota bacterium]|nr:transglutaminase-like domain-containing protein [Actinomycetota bacterium]
MRDAVARFSEIVEKPEEDIDLDRAVLAIAAGAEPDLDIDFWLLKLDEFASGVATLKDLTDRLFNQLGFRGDTSSYGDPQNSLLPRVIERRRGIPISLSVLMMEVGRRAGIPLEGIGMPGHFLVRSVATGDYLDPFNMGEVLDLHGCEERFRAASGMPPEVEFGPEMLPVVSKLQILTRMLNNLQQTYRAAINGADLEWVVRMKTSIPGSSPEEVVTLARALVLQGRVTDGAAEVEAAAERHPALRDGLLTVARALRASLN